jgi:L-alanine-DL-glutamate epimerase-like enolase superfamily enzyme
MINGSALFRVFRVFRGPLSALGVVVKITDVKAIHINPRLAIRNAGHEVRFAGIDTQTVFRVKTDNGITGYGDSRGHVSLVESEIEAMIDRSPADFLGADLATGLVGAIYDAVGKYLEVPAYRLIGPKVRDRVPVAAWTRPASPEDFARELQRAVDEGYHLFKMHTCAHHCVFAQTRAAEDVLPSHFRVHYDLNHNRTRNEVIHIVHELAASPIVGVIEDPLVPEDLEGWRLLRTQLSVPILMHVPRLGGGPEILSGCADLLMIGEMGIGTSIKRGYAASVANLSTVIQLTGGTLSKAMAMHLGAVIPKVSHSINLDDQYEDDGSGSRLQVCDGSTPVPEEPGLGIDVDESILESLAARPKTEIPKHVGILHLLSGDKWYSPSTPSAVALTGFAEGNVRGIRSEIWNDDGSAEFSQIYDRVQTEGAFKEP